MVGSLESGSFLKPPPHAALCLPSILENQMKATIPSAKEIRDALRYFQDVFARCQIR